MTLSIKVARLSSDVDVDLHRRVQVVYIDGEPRHS